MRENSSSGYEDFPEVLEIVYKLKTGSKLTKIDERNLKEICNGSGWSCNDIVEDLKSLETDPKSREERYRELFRKYYAEAKEYYERAKKEWSMSGQAAEKLWGAITALVKLYAARKGLFVIHWDHGKLYNFVNNNVELPIRDLFISLLTYGAASHRHGMSLDPSTFETLWKKCKELLEKLDPSGSEGSLKSEEAKPKIARPWSKIKPGEIEEVGEEITKRI